MATTRTTSRRPSTAARSALALGALSAPLVLSPMAAHAAAGVDTTAAASRAGHFDGCVAPDWPIPGQDPHCHHGA
ncbi:hypothetical protein [Clavibacter michiganensis]|uniref:Uncharacterized protein n=1 Tax=Clavibacter michiganensis subsp. insidiosus TaxID=33014 RepID=A0A0D5CFD9_9MICO|nr:hypothetical protein [Clavibacter michiganensis]AJW77972.1 hypothetical protein VO01_01420 [Clavibacter michiganensis subsp. insidiosus]AWF99663.1 hypothetical protein BEH61_14235 [Clavibacter michiganensis subsp. insidiosus]AWG00217.1 hypothetical protein BEH62_01220 [Clavibacter michiganensis subsp. insidiosus]OQJ61135.1 hypothetical protein B5P21_15360 [Clavibacter michiganensis subsp. insidiosus]RII86001.1 hypothetical protein DZF92_12175 [Clavibacter michiganensis subsp. insidiosus]